MTISHSELRRNARYAELDVTKCSSVEPDTVSFSIAIAGIEELVELECDWTGRKSIFIYDEMAGRISIDVDGPVFSSWSDELKRKITELLGELAEWEASMRKPRGPWDIRLLADPNRCFDDIETEGQD